MGQKFFASNDTFTWPNGAVGHRPGGPMDCLGPYAKVKNCPVHGTTVRLTCYAADYADTAFSVPASTRYKGKHIKGYFSHSDDGVEFHVMDPFKKHFGELGPNPEQMEAILAFKERHGRFWKTKLGDMWLDGRDASQPGGHLLRQVRNTFGPQWLANFKENA